MQKEFVIHEGLKRNQSRPARRQTFETIQLIANNFELLEDLAARRDFLLREIGSIVSSPSKKSSRLP